MTVAAEVFAGDLEVSGAPEGAIEIVAVGTESFDVFEAGELVASVDGVHDDIRIDFADGDTERVDAVRLQLAGADVDRVVADLGEGSNTLVLENGAIRGSMQYYGGADDDTVEMGDDFSVGRSMSTFLGDGDNTLEVEGAVERSLRVNAGEGDDLVRLSEDSHVHRRVTLRTGNGDNTTMLEGDIGGSFYYRGGDGDDLIDILASSAIQGRTNTVLGDGDNDVNIDGGLGSHLNAFAEGGDDQFATGPSSLVAGNMRLRTGAGNDLFDQHGQVEGMTRIDVFPEPAPPVASSALTAQAAPNIDLAQLLNGMLLQFQATGRFIAPLASA